MRAVEAIGDVSLEIARERVRVHRGPVGLRQDDAAEVHVAACSRRPPARCASRRAGQRPAGAHGPRLPGVQPLAVPVDDRAPERRVPAEAQAARQGRGAALVEEAVGSVGLERRARPLSVAALGRDAAARRDRAGARLSAGHPADGRAVRVRRRADPRRPRGPRARGAAALRRDDRLRHPRHRRVRLPVRPHHGPHALAHGGAGGPHRGPLPQPRDQVATKELRSSRTCAGTSGARSSAARRTRTPAARRPRAWRPPAEPWSSCPACASSSRWCASATRSCASGWRRCPRPRSSRSATCPC